MPNQTTPDPYDLQRFVTAQESVYASVLQELKAGQNAHTGMWFIFPQVDGLGMGETTRFCHQEPARSTGIPGTSDPGEASA